MADSSIEWLFRPGTKPKTWNPLGGCSEDGPDCEGCYAKGMAARIPNMARARGNTRLVEQYDGLTRKTAKGRVQWTGVIRTFDERLDQPLSWRTPCTVFVNSMSDLFHVRVPFHFIRRVFAIMEACPQHTFIVLTKRLDRALEFVREHGGCPPNVWLGFSAGDQETFDRRSKALPDLQNELGAGHVLLASLEPLLGPIAIPSELLRALSWVITGGESNQTYHKARPCNVQWIRSLVEQCLAAGVAVFVKQLGAEPGFKLEDEERRGNPMPSFHHGNGGLFIKKLKDRKGANPSEWPEELRVRQWPRAA